MAELKTIVGIDVGTTKICTIVGEQDREGRLNIIGVGITPSAGLRKGVVVNIEETVNSIVTALDKAERLSGQKITTAYVGVAGSHIDSINSKGVVAISPSTRDINAHDISRAIEAARAIAIPNSREIIHVIPRGYVVDGQEGVKDPIGMSGFRLEVETHIVTGAVTSIHNLIKCVQKSRVEIDDLVLEPLASSEAVLTLSEKDLGVVLVDIGGGTTDVAIFVEGAIWHTVVLPVGGNLVTNDIVYGLRLPFPAAEEIKVRYGHTDPAQVGEQEIINVQMLNAECQEPVSRYVLAQIIEARMEEIFTLVAEQIRRSGYDGLLPAGAVITGGAAELPGVEKMARTILDLPVRIGTPSGLHGLSDSISRPAYATGVGLLLWGLRHAPDPSEEELGGRDSQKVSDIYKRFKKWLRAFLP